MISAPRALDWLFTHIALPTVAVGAGMLHVFTAYTAFTLVDGSWMWRCIAAIAAWAGPLLGEVGVAYYAWRASGSMVNAYSFWLLLWVAFSMFTAVLAWLRTESEASNAQNAAP